MFAILISKALKACLVAVPLAFLASATSASTPSFESSPGESAPVALLVDLTSGQVLHAKNASRRIMPASMTKTMTAFVAFELIKEGKLSLRQKLAMSDETFKKWNGEGSTMWLETETPTSVDDLLKGILSVSANDGSIVLAEGAAGSVEQWTELMNKKAHELNMTGSHFGTPNGFPDEGYTFTTAHDLVKLANAIITRHPKLFAKYFAIKTFEWNNIKQPNRNPLLAGTDGADGLKTGYTREAGSSLLGTAKRGGQRLVLVLAGFDNSSDRDRIAREYMEWGFASFDRRRLFGKGDQVGTARVQSGTARSVALVTDRDVFANVPQLHLAELSATIEYDGPIRAPFKKGQKIATLVVDVPEMEPARVPLLAAEDVGEAGFFIRLANGIAGWFS